jgi:PAS domain S-box-containing protein
MYSGNQKREIAMIRVLYVDDEPDLLEIGKLYLEESRDFVITTIDSARAALALLKNDQFDAIISDYQMPNMDGIELLKYIRSTGDHIPFIIFTGRGREEIVIEALNSGADFYLQKGGDPVAQFAELRHKILSAIGSHRADQKVREKTEELDRFFENALDLLCIADTDGNLRRLSRQWETTLGFLRSDMEGKSFFYFVHPDDIASTQEAVAKLSSGEPTINFVNRFRCRDGSYRHIEWRSYPIGNLIYAAAMDITDRIKAEDDAKRSHEELEASYEELTATSDSLRNALETLAEKENLYRTLFHEMLNGFAVHEIICDENDIPRDYRFLEVNEAFEQMTGLHKDSLIGKTVLEVMPETESSWIERYGRVALTGIPDHFDNYSRVLDKYFEVTTYQNAPRQFTTIISDVTDRKLSERAIKDSERKYRNLYQYAQVGLFETSIKDGTVIACNDRYATLAGFSSVNDAIGMDIVHLYANVDDRVEIIRILREQGHIDDHIVMFKNHTTGLPFWAQFSARIDREKDIAEGTIIDISEQKRAVEALTENHDRFEQISGHSREIIWEVDPDGLFTYVSPASLAIIGYSPKELIGKKFFYDLHPQDGREAFKTSTLEAFIQQKVLCDLINAMQTKDGQVVWMSTNGMPIFDAFNNFQGYRGSNSDITERKEADEIRTRFGRILESSLNEIYFFDAQTLRFVDVNHGARENIGYSMEELRTMTPFDIATEYTPESFESLLSPLRSGEKDIQVAFTVHKRKDGSLYPIEAHVQYAGNEVLPVFVAIILDITERKQTEEALRLANWKLNLLSGITRHDINNQLTVLLGYLSLLEMNPSDPSLMEYIRKMDASAKRISSMIQFTKEYDEIGITLPAWQDIFTQVTTAAKEISFGKIQLNNDLPAGMEVFAEPLIFKVFYNLMDNAVRYGESITTIRFSVENRSGDQIIICKDDGVGIPAMDKENIFLRGFGKNTGLGLALSQEILEITGISIEETGEPGKGARFEITVPKGMWRFTGNKV